MTDQTLTMADPAAWWDDLYDARHGDTLATATLPAPAPAGDRLPPPGSVVSLDAAAPKTDGDDKAEQAEQDAAYEEFDDDELADDDESDDEQQDAAQPWSRVAEFHPRQVRDYVVEHHGDAHKRFWKLVYNASAAGMGWGFGWEPRLHAVLVECGRETGDTGAAMVLGAAAAVAAVVLIDLRSRGWWWPLAWVCRIPLATAVLALALYTPNAIG